MPHEFGQKQLKLKRGDIRVRTRGGLTTLVWKDRREVYMLTNMDPPPAEGNFCDDSEHTVKPHIVERHNQHVGYIDNSDYMANSYSMSRHTFKWTTKLFFHFLDPKVLNIWILLSSFSIQDCIIPGNGSWLKRTLTINLLWWYSVYHLHTLILCHKTNLCL
jgi:hypothetical protein